MVSGVEVKERTEQVTTEGATRTGEEAIARQAAVNIDKVLYIYISIMVRMNGLIDMGAKKRIEVVI